MNKSKILVTGGAGFIGSNIVDYFLDLGHQVVCFDDLSCGFEKNIDHNYTNSNFTFIKGDIRKLELCREAVSGCDYVSHQAALGSVPRSIKDPIKTNSVNVDGFLNMLIAARDENIKRFVYASSSSIYGDSTYLPKVESKIGSPVSPYAATKLMNEFYANVFSENYGMECIGLRYFNVFGKRQDPNGAYSAVIPIWIKQLINHENAVINGDGSFSRDFTYIEDVLQANDKSLFTDINTIKKKQEKYYQLKDEELDRSQIRNNLFEIFNVSYDSNTSLFELYNMLHLSLSRYDDKIKSMNPIFREKRIGDIPHSQGSILKIKSVLGFNPKFSTIQGIDKTVDWYFNNL
tara:strand:- start:274 stop:1314 length:1041 start_codon:yes stop_codon:yes gene_type:complete